MAGSTSCQVLRQAQYQKSQEHISKAMAAERVYDNAFRPAHLLVANKSATYVDRTNHNQKANASKYKQRTENLSAKSDTEALIVVDVILLEATKSP